MINTKGFFADIFKHSRENCVLVMDSDGVILEVNQSFLTAFGYKQSNIVGKNFSILFTEKDLADGRPGKEIKNALTRGAMSDNNYLLHRDGTPLWVMGESVLVQNDGNEKYLVKIIQNINTQKKLERILMESTEFFNTVFDSVKDAGFLILNSELRVLRCNKTFLKIFELKNQPALNTKYSRIENSFWRRAEIQKKLADVLVSGKAFKKTEFSFTTSKGKEKIIEITSKIMETEDLERSMLLVIKMI